MLARLIVLWAVCAAVARADEFPAPALPEPSGIGWLWTSRRPEQEPIRYVPREGDLMFTSSAMPLRTAAYLAFRTGHPLHTGMIVRGADGKLGLFETGGGERKTTTLLPIDERFNEQVTKSRAGLLWIRPIRGDLTPEESSRLTAFATAQLGKPLVPNRRYLWLAIPGRPASPSRSDQAQWICSELVVESLREAGLLSTELSSASIVPADLFYDRRIDLSDRWLPPFEWTPEPVLPKERPWLAPAPTIGLEQEGD